LGFGYKVQVVVLPRRLTHLTPLPHHSPSSTTPTIPSNLPTLSEHSRGLGAGGGGGAGERLGGVARDVRAGAGLVGREAGAVRGAGGGLDDGRRRQRAVGRRRVALGDGDRLGHGRGRGDSRVDLLLGVGAGGQGGGDEGEDGLELHFVGWG
jgi:hypothetical protein